MKNNFFHNISSIIFIIIFLIILYLIYLNYKKTNIESFNNANWNYPNKPKPIISMNPNKPIIWMNPNKPIIWMYWETLPGRKKPGYIDLCYNSVLHNCSKCFDIKYLNEQNIQQYIPEISDYNISQLKIQHKADVYRYLLLNKYGGLWVDADILVLKCLCKYYKNLDNHDYVGFGCGYSKKSCSQSLYGYGSPLNWMMGAKPNSKFLKCIVSNVDKRLKNGNSIQYHEIGKDILRKCHNDLKENENWSYYHVPSKCNEYDNWGNKLNNIFKNIDNSKCENERYFYPFYNTAPGYPQWFKDLTAEQIMEYDLPIRPIIKEAFSANTGCNS